MHFLTKLLFTTTAALSACIATAQGFPNKPVKMVIGLPPGGGTDSNARLIASKLSESLGQSVLVDNRPGASGAIAAEFTAAAPPDGHTILIMSATTLTNTLLYKSRYDTIRDFTPITFLSVNPYLVLIHPAVPANNLNEFIAHARANPGKLNYASSGNGGIVHLATVLLESVTDIRLLHVPYKGLAVAYGDLLAGRVQLSVSSIVSALPHVKSGKLRALGVTSRTRMAMLPDMPTLNESGARGYEVSQWNGLLGPAGVPRAVVDRLHREIIAVLRQPEVVARMAADGSEVVGGTGAELAAYMQSELSKWGGIIRKWNIKGDE